jgi:hypothetical protein
MQALFSTGDSTMEDTVFDLAILLSGVAKDERNMDKFIDLGIHADVKDEFMELEIPDSNVVMNFCHGRRNVTITDGVSHIYIKHRFTGHVMLKANMLGLKTFFRDDFKDELNCMLGFTEERER